MQYVEGGGLPPQAVGIPAPGVPVGLPAPPVVQHPVGDQPPQTGAPADPYSGPPLTGGSAPPPGWVPPGVKPGGPAQSFGGPSLVPGAPAGTPGGSLPAWGFQLGGQQGPVSPLLQALQNYYSQVSMGQSLLNQDPVFLRGYALGKYHAGG